MDIFYAGLGGGGDFGGARFFSAWIWGGTISLEKVLGGHDFLFEIAIRKIYISYFSFIATLMMRSVFTFLTKHYTSF